MLLERHRLTTTGEKTREYLKRADIIPTALSHCTLNTQILRSHGGHIATDHTLTKTKIMALTETWLKNNERADIPGYRPVAQWKGETMRAGGVCIYERLELSSVLTTTEHELVDLDTKTKEIMKAERAHTGIGDACAVETTIGGRRTLIMAVYLTPGTSMEKLELYFFKNLMGYSTRLIGLSKAYDKLGCGTMPLIVCGNSTSIYRPMRDQNSSPL